MDHVRGAPNHPQTQGKIERCIRQRTPSVNTDNRLSNYIRYCLNLGIVP